VSRADGGLAAEVDVEVDVTDPDVPVITVRMCNAASGARWPGDTVTLAAGLARALLREGLAERA